MGKAFSGNNSNFLDGELQEAIFYESSVASKKSEIETDINNFIVYCEASDNYLIYEKEAEAVERADTEGARIGYSYHINGIGTQVITLTLK